MTDHTEANPNRPEDDAPDAPALPTVGAMLKALSDGFNRGLAVEPDDRTEDAQAAIAELGSYAASMIVAAAHAEPMNKMAADLAELIHGTGRTGDTSRDNLSSTFSALAEAADDRLFRMIREGAPTAEIGGSYDRGIMYHRLTRIRETLRELDGALGSVLGEFGPYTPDHLIAADGDPDTEADGQDEDHAGD